MQILFLKKIIYLLYIHYILAKIFDFYYFIYGIMMKKNLFILFSLYFFVLQPIFLWLFRWESKFFYLSIINLFFILLISLFTKEKIENKIETKTDHKVDFIEKPHHIQKTKSYKKVSHVWFFVLCVLSWAFVWFLMPDIILSLKLIFVVLWSFVLFILFGVLFKFNILKVWESKIYMIVLLWLFVWYILMFFDLNFYNNDLEKNIDQKISINTGISFVAVDADLTWDTGSTSWMVLVENISDLDLSKNATFADVIKYLIDKNSIKLIEKKNIKLDYISYNNDDYPYYRTAYSLWMIGKTLNPSKTLLCETFVVMVWLAEKWNIWSYSDIKQAYWNYAKTNNKLPNCQYWKFLTMVDLK